jgi:hypothetical protein
MQGMLPITDYTWKNHVEIPDKQHNNCVIGEIHPGVGLK